MNVIQAERKIKKKQSEIAELEEFIALVNDYKPQTLTQEIIYLYARTGNMLTVVDYINESGYRLENGKFYRQANISAIIRSNPKGDRLHTMVRKFLRTKDMSKKRDF